MDNTIKDTRRRQFMGAVFSATASLAVPRAFSQPAAFPTHPVRMIVPFGAGGSVDAAARDLAQGLSQLWGQPVVVENHAGASSTVGNALVARSPADGYTLLFVSSHIVITPAMFSKLPYDPSKDFTPLTLAADVPIVLVVNPKVPAKNVAELLALARKDPGKLTFASSGNGGMAHLSGEMFTSMTHTRIQHVPYKGDAPALNDLLGGQVDMMFCAASSAMPLIQSGKLRAIAWAGSESVAPLADLPTIAQSGVPGYAAASWVGLFGPGNMPAALRERIAADATKVLSDPALRERQGKLGLQTATMTPQAFDRYVQAELPKWNQLVKSIGVTMD
jgi:tripartite-type tricarboxylate transporter receptor subunit TctC